MVLADGQGTPLGIYVAAASPSEMKLVEATLDSISICASRSQPARPQRLVADRGYDSNQVRALLVKRQIEPIIPARSNNQVATHQDGRKLRRYRHRWIVERTNSWLQTFRRLVVRYEYLSAVFIALVHMACVLVTLKKVLG
jgi:transposase